MSARSSRIVHSEIPPELKALSSFHGHLGPYVVVGYRMGLFARSELKGKMKATVYTGLRPPVSCIVDGIQFSSGCTLGKGNIQVLDGNMARVVFTSEDEEMVMDLRTTVRNDIESQMTKETEEHLAMSIFRAHMNDLFDIRRAKKANAQRSMTSQ
ncbi:MAG: formylmethanofuran dehydrogenase subunit E family protein [Methanomassiliicoccales archaeon]|nr:MAG: formylmethanofuran dehydrogenase subunit E family protein [Methanomassiliicoccales archaeon]